MPTIKTAEKRSRMSENNTNNGPPLHRRPTASSSTSPAHSVNSNTHHPPPGGGGGAAYNPHSMQGGQGRGRGSHLPIGPAGAAIGGGAVGVGGGGQADDIAALIAVASGTPGATLNPRLLSAQIAMRNQAMVRAQVAHQAHAARHNNNRLTSPQPTFGGGVEHNNNPSSSRGGPTVSSSMPMHPPPPYPPSPHAPPPHGGMPAPPAAAAASWALGSSAKALRTLALMKSLGVSPSATALAAAVLPTNANALPKTAAALNAAAAAGYLHRSGGGGGGAPTRAGAGEGGGASATVAQGASGSDGATPIANTAKTNAGMASATAGAGAGAGAGGFAYPRPQSATNMRMPYQHPYLNQVSMANNNNTNNKDGGDINNDESNSVTGGAPASASAQPRLATASSAGSGGPPHLPLRPNNMSHLDFYAQLQAKYNHLPTNIPTATANLNLNHQLQLQQNHPQSSRSAGGSPSRQSMQQAYGEENPVFYERLVQILGKEMADEMVKEAVDETIKEEVEGEGSSEGGVVGTTREEAGGTGTAEEKIEGKMKGINEEEKPYSTTSVAAAVEKKAPRNEEVIAIDSSDDDDEGKSAPRMKAAETTTAALEHRIAQKQKELSSATGVLPHQNAVSPNKKPGATALAASPSSQHTKESLLLSSSPQFGSRGITGVPNPLPTPAQLAAMRRNVLKKRQQPHLGVRYHAPVVHEDIDKNKRKAGAAAVDNNAAPPSPQKSTMAKNTTTAGAAAAAAAAASETRATTMVDLTDNIMKRRKLHQGPPGPAVNASSSMNSNLLHSLFGRSSQDYYQGAPGVVAATAAAPSTQAASTQSASAAARGGNNNNNSGTITGQQITAEQGGVVYGRDPPGFEQFRADPEFCRLIVEAAEKHKKDCANGSSNKKDVKSVGAVFVHGLLNIDDGQIRESLALDADRSVRDYVRDVISPYFNVPLNLVDSEGNWEAYVHISSDNINEFARNVVYRRRKSMKSAVELAFYELRKHERKSQKEENEADSDSKKTSTNNINEKTSQSNAVHEEELRAKDKRIKEHEEELRAKDKRIKELEKELAMLNGNHDKQVAAIKDEHAKETKDKQKKYGDFVANLVKTHRKEVSDLKKQMKTMQSVHTTFLESYVEASVDALRYESDSPSL